MEQNERLPIRDARRLARQLRSLRSGNAPASLMPNVLNRLELDEISVPPNTLVEPLIEALHDKDVTIRATAVRKLSALDERVPIEPLLEALHDEQRFIRAEAARALGALGEQTPIDPLVEALEDEDGSVRVAAAQALAMLGKRAPLEPLVTALYDEWSPVREAAVQALGMLGERIPVHLLVAALEDQDKFVRTAAVFALGMLEERAPLEPLVRALGDKQKSVREAAIQILGSMGDRVLVEPLISALNSSRWPPMREAVVNVLGMLGKRVPVEPLMAAVDDEWPPVRIAALQALQRTYPGVLSTMQPEEVTEEKEQPPNNIEEPISAQYSTDRSDQNQYTQAQLDAHDSSQTDMHNSTRNSFDLLLILCTLLPTCRSAVDKHLSLVPKLVRAIQQRIIPQHFLLRHGAKRDTTVFLVVCIVVAWLLRSQKLRTSTLMADSALSLPSSGMSLNTLSTDQLGTIQPEC